MKTPINRRIVLASRPQGEPTPEHFRLEETAVPQVPNGKVLLQTHFMSLDPYMRGRMNAGPSYAPPVEIGGVMGGGTVSQVVESKAPGFRPGDWVLAQSGWQDYAVADPKTLRTLDPGVAPLTTSLGVLGMPGMTAYTGLLNIGQPKTGETIVVAAASGAVGSVVGQIARIKGCRAIGIAGGSKKCEYVTNELGFDGCIDHRSPDFAAQLKAACPNGIDVYFENVGGKILDAVVPMLNPFGRVPVCGLIAHYNATELPPGPDHTPLLMSAVLRNRLTLRGFIVMDFADQQPQFLRDMAEWVQQGKIKYHEDIIDGFENTIRAFQGLLRGENFGKSIVRVVPNS